jgi:hypothetical protein
MHHLRLDSAQFYREVVVVRLGRQRDLAAWRVIVRQVVLQVFVRQNLGAGRDEPGVVPGVILVIIGVDQDPYGLLRERNSLRLGNDRFIVAGQFAVHEDESIGAQAEQRITAATGDHEQTGLYRRRVESAIHGTCARLFFALGGLC